MHLRFTYITGEIVAWTVQVDGSDTYAVHVALARLSRPCAAQALDWDRDAVLNHASRWLAADAFARWTSSTTLVITTDDGHGPRLVVSADDPERVIALATQHLAAGIRPVLPSSDGIPTHEFVVSGYSTRDLAATGRYVLDRERGLLASSDAGTLYTGMDGARLLFVLMSRGEPVPLRALEEVVARPEVVLREVQRCAALEEFPLPIIVRSGSAAVPTLPTPCSLPSRCLSEQELRGIGLGVYSRRHAVFVGCDGVSVTRKGARWWRAGDLMPLADGQRQLLIAGSDIAEAVVPLELDPCGGHRGLRALIKRVMAGP